MRDCLAAPRRCHCPPLSGSGHTPEQWTRRGGWEHGEKLRGSIQMRIVPPTLPPAAGTSIRTPQRSQNPHLRKWARFPRAPLPRPSLGSVGFDTSPQPGGGPPRTFGLNKSSVLEVAGPACLEEPAVSPAMAQSPPLQSLLGQDHWIFPQGWGWVGHSDSTSPASSSSDSSGSCPCDRARRPSQPAPAARGAAEAASTAPSRARTRPAGGQRQSASEREKQAEGEGGKSAVHGVQS